MEYVILIPQGSLNINYYIRHSITFEVSLAINIQYIIGSSNKVPKYTIYTWVPIQNGEPFTEELDKGVT